MSLKEQKIIVYDPWCAKV